MKVISIWQPWASLVVIGIKRFETRTWQPNKSMRLEAIGIHAAKQFNSVQKAAFYSPAIQGAFAAVGIHHHGSLPRGALVGYARFIMSVKSTHPDINKMLTKEEMDLQKQLGDWRPGRFVWYLNDPISLKEPIPMMGQQGFWNWEG